MSILIEPKLTHLYLQQLLITHITLNIKHHTQIHALLSRFLFVLNSKVDVDKSRNTFTLMRQHYYRIRSMLFDSGFAI